MSVLGVDLGGTKIAAALVTADGVPGPVLTVPTPAHDGPAAILDAVAGLARAVVADAVASAGAAGAPVPGVGAVGIGTAGVVDVGRGVIVSSTDALTGWAGTEVAAGVRVRLAGASGFGGAADGEDRGSSGALPVFVENDVDAHAAGEAWLGAAAGASSALMVAVGTGVGASVVLAGRPLRGAHHVAGEMGHLPIGGADGLRCSCGRPGHLESIGSGPALHRLYRARGGDAAALDTRDVVARASAGEALALRVVEESASAVGRAIAAVVTVLDPAVVVVGGGLAGAGPVWWEPMERALRAEVIDVLADVPLVPAALGGTAAIVGAARGAWALLDPSDVEE
ncbi:ROK family protein [Cellulomonas fimi]|uniref:ROK family protein n=1 Tax=Cellulomonas fimi TaxID=1708 RepID=A0A7Y0QIK4_CELFI|nr:ROK family protein [Cellulomonas fimi]